MLENGGVILLAPSSKSPVNAKNFGIYARDTKSRFSAVYPDSRMTPTVHKILNHGAAAIRYHAVPIGLLSEAPQESRHKDCRNFKTSNARKMSREVSLFDFYVMLSETLDLLVGVYRKCEREARRGRDSDPAVEHLLMSEADNIHAATQVLPSTATRN